MFGVPGKQLFAALPKSPIRGMLAAAGRLFVFAGGEGGAIASAYEVFADSTFTELGQIGTGTTPVQAFVNGTQMFIIAGNQGYLADGATITPVVPAMTGGFLDGYFFAAQPVVPPGLEGTRFRFSALRDGSVWDPLDFGTAEAYPDYIRSILANREQLWIFGQEHTEVWENVGDLDNPFQRIQSAMIEEGCSASWSPAKDEIGGTYWLSGDTRGGPVVMGAKGWSPERISTHAVEQAIQKYADVSDAVGYCYQQDGHAFYVLSFPSADATWVWDRSSGMWHERGFWDNTVSRYRADKARFHAFVFGKHLVAPGTNGLLYEQAFKFKDDAGFPLRRMRVSPHVNQEAQFVRHLSLQIDMQVGEGINAGGFDPATVMLRFSDDGGRSWSSEFQLSAGKVGQMLQRVKMWRLGYSRDRVYEVVISDPIDVCLVNGYLDVQVGGKVA